MPLDRRHFLAVCSAAGVAGTLLPGTLYTLAAQAEQQGSESPKTPQPITDEMLQAAAALAGVPLTAEQRAMMLDGEVTIVGRRGKGTTVGLRIPLVHPEETRNPRPSCES